MISGIYRIINTINGIFYIGSSKNIKKRIRNHFSHLKLNKHHNIYIQNSYNKYGKDNFTYEIVELVEEGELILKEQEYLDYYFNNDFKLYNLSKTASGGDLLSYHPNKENILNKIKYTLKKMYKNNPELSKKISEKMKGINNPMFGKTHSKETREKISNFLKGKPHTKIKKLTNEQKQKMSELWKGKRTGKDNGFYGKKHKEEFKKNMSEKKIENYKNIKTIEEKMKINPQSKPVIIEGKIFLSQTIASKELNIDSSLVSFRINSKNPRFQKWCLISIEGFPYKPLNNKQTGKVKYVDKEQQNKICTDYLNLFSSKEIAIKHNLSSTCVLDILKKNNVKIRTQSEAKILMYIKIKNLSTK